MLLRLTYALAARKRHLIPKLFSMTRILVNSLPKSGTHLLAKAVEQCGYTEHFDPDNLNDPARITPLFFNYKEVKNGLAQLSAREMVATEKAVCVGTLTPIYVAPNVFRQWLDGMRHGKYVLGHLGRTPALTNLLHELDYKHLFIIRDPRAVLTSLLSFILDTRGMPKPHFLENDFRQLSQDERLAFLLNGGYAPLAGVAVRGFADVYRSMLAWRDAPSCLFVKFEELVGVQGGGDEQLQREAIGRIRGYLGADNSTSLDSLYDPSSRTFRKGNIHSWRNAHDAQTLDTLTVYCASLCSEAGYD